MAASKWPWDKTPLLCPFLSKEGETKVGSAVTRVYIQIQRHLMRMANFVTLIPEVSKNLCGVSHILP